MFVAEQVISFLAFLRKTWNSSYARFNFWMNGKISTADHHSFWVYLQLLVVQLLLLARLYIEERWMEIMENDEREKVYATFMLDFLQDT